MNSAPYYPPEALSALVVRAAGMAMLAMAIPIPAGKTEQWKEFLSELAGARKAELACSSVGKLVFPASTGFWYRGGYASNLSINFSPNPGEYPGRWVLGRAHRGAHGGILFHDYAPLDSSPGFAPDAEACSRGRIEQLWHGDWLRWTCCESAY